MMLLGESTEKSMDLLSEEGGTCGAACSRSPPTRESFNLYIPFLLLEEEARIGGGHNSTNRPERIKMYGMIGYKCGVEEECKDEAGFCAFFRVLGQVREARSPSSKTTPLSSQYLYILP